MLTFWVTATIDSANADVQGTGTAKQPKSETAVICEDSFVEVLARAEDSTSGTHAAFWISDDTCKPTERGSTSSTSSSSLSSIMSRSVAPEAPPGDAAT
jgi:hypothetical protein